MTPFQGIQTNKMSCFRNKCALKNGTIPAVSRIGPVYVKDNVFEP